MTEEQLQIYGFIGADWEDWEGWSEGYTWEEGADFFKSISDRLFTLVDSIKESEEQKYAE